VVYLSGIHLYAYVSGRPLVFVDRYGLKPKDGDPCPISNRKVKVIAGFKLMWVYAPAPPSTSGSLIDMTDDTCSALGVYDKLPGPAKPPIAVSPGIVKACKALMTQAGKLVNPAKVRDGVRIWVKLECYECGKVCIWNFRYRWISTWKKKGEAWHLCTRQSRRPGGGFVLGGDELASALPACAREALDSGSCYESSRPWKEQHEAEASHGH